MKSLVCILLFMTVHGITVASDLNGFARSADLFFKKYVSNGSVAYAKIKANPSEINELYEFVGTISLNNVNDNAKKAFYINAYNLIVIHAIVQRYPVKSPMDIGGFFDKKTHQVAGEQLTLNKLEKEKLLIPYQDARFHFVLVCAAKSCPSLMSAAFTPENVEEQLKQRTKLSVNDNGWLKVDNKQKTVQVSKIFEWYNGDFTTDNKSILDWINEYRANKIPTTFKLSYYEYNWALND